MDDMLADVVKRDRLDFGIAEEQAVDDGAPGNDRKVYEF